MTDVLKPVARSAAGIQAQREKIATEAAKNMFDEASGDVEDVLRMLTSRWAEMGFTKEQIVWCVALVTVNMRETFPAANGGQDAFDAICAEAAAYYRKNAG